MILLALCFASVAQAAHKHKAKPVAAPPVVVTVPPLTPDNTWNLDLSTGGRVTIQLRPDKAPMMVARIKLLSRRGFYDGLVFHRVIDGFMAQAGDPRGTGEGGSELPDVKAEFNDLPHVRGTVSAARTSDEDSANSQFFIMFQPNLKLDGHYSAFGRVVSGMQYVDAIERGEPPANPSRIVKATIASDPDRAPIPQPAVLPPPAQPAAAAETPAVAPAPAAPPTTAEAKAAAKAAKAAEKGQAEEAKSDKKAAAKAAKEAKAQAAANDKIAKKAAAEAAKAKPAAPVAPTPTEPASQAPATIPE